MQTSIVAVNRVATRLGRRPPVRMPDYDLRGHDHMTDPSRRADIFDGIPDHWKDIVHPDFGITLRKMEELCREMEAAIEVLEKSDGISDDP